MIYGVDYLGGNHYQRALMNTHPAGWCAGIFLNTFGKARDTVEAMAKSRKFSEIVVHLAPFDNDHLYPIRKLQPQLEKDSAWLEGLAKACPWTIFLISPFCEHNHRAKEMRPLFVRLDQLAPSCLFVNSIWKGEEVNGTITEIHLTNSRLPRKPRNEYIITFDGFGGDGSGDFPDTNIEKVLNAYPDARQIRLWNFRYNGKFGHKDTASVSDRKNWPNESYLRGHNAMMKKREGALSWPSNALYKPFADDHGAGGKDNKAMCILPRGKNSVKVLARNGVLIDIMKTLGLPPSDTNPKGPRFYSSLYAYQLADKAEKVSGSRQIQIDGMPLTDGDLRSGLFR